MDLPVGPPMDPMLARLARDLPDGDGWVYEPKWDGFRGLAFCACVEVDLRSRHQRPLARYFPELVAALRPLYSLRGEWLPTVSTPVGWDELEAAVQAGDDAGLLFGPGDVLDRVTAAGDRFAPVLGAGQALPAGPPDGGPVR